MALKRLPLDATPPKVAWLVPGLVPSGYLTVIFSKAGEGKTRLMSFLAVQVARPQGSFAGYPVRSGRVVILDADDPAGLGYRKWIAHFAHAYADADLGRIDLMAVEGGLVPEDVDALAQELTANPPALIILDAFSSAFLGLDVIKAHLVHAPIRALTSLAQETGAALVLVDHVGKPAPGQTIAEKGPLGSAAKLFAPRAAFALDRVPPAEVEGRDVVRLLCVKQSYAAVPPPLGLELLWTEDGEGAFFRPYRLPGADTLEARAEAAILALLAEVPAGLARKELVASVVRKANVSERTAARALAKLKGQGVVEEETLGGRGSPKVLKLVQSTDGTLARNSRNDVQDGAYLMPTDLARNRGDGTKSEGEEGEWLWF